MKSQEETENKNMHCTACQVIPNGNWKNNKKENGAKNEASCMSPRKGSVQSHKDSRWKIQKNCCKVLGESGTIVIY